MLAPLLLTTGCREYRRIAIADVDPTEWRRMAAVRIENDDTLAYVDLFFTLRYNASFEADSLPIVVTTVAPDSVRFVEPVTLRLRPSPEAAALMRDTAIPYRRRVVLGRCGTYRIGIMPRIPVHGIEAIGIKIEKSE